MKIKYLFLMNQSRSRLTLLKVVRKSWILGIIYNSVSPIDRSNCFYKKATRKSTRGL